MGDDAFITTAARASFARKAEDYTEAQNHRLIKHLAKESHWTPLAHAQLTLRIKLPLWLHGQLVKHTVGAVISTMSRRYVSEDIEIYQPKWRAAPKKGVKQGSGEELTISEELHTNDQWYIKVAVEHYNDLLTDGVAPEQARGRLPQDLMTTCVVTGSLVYWARVYKQRNGKHGSPQKEWKLITDRIDEECSKLFPVTWQALKG